MTAQRKLRKRRAYARHYDVEMIGEFLNHLRWEYAINHFENTHVQSTVNEELVEQLSRYIRKYNTVGLMKALELDRDGASEEAIEQARAVSRQKRADRADQVLAALDVLEPIFEEAFTCAAEPNTFFVERIKVTDECGGTQ